MAGYGGGWEEESSYNKANLRDLFLMCRHLHVWILCELPYSLNQITIKQECLRSKKVSRVCDTYINSDSSHCLLEQVWKWSQSNRDFFSMGVGRGFSVLIIVLYQLNVLFVSLFLMCSKFRIYTNSKSNLYRLKTFQQAPPNWWCACVKLMSGRPIGSQVEQSLALGIRFSAMLVVHFYCAHCCFVHFHLFTSCCIFQFGVLSDNTFQPVFFFNGLQI